MELNCPQSCWVERGTAARGQSDKALLLLAAPSLLEGGWERSPSCVSR